MHAYQDATLIATLGASRDRCNWGVSELKGRGPASKYNAVTFLYGCVKRHNTFGREAHSYKAIV